MMYNSKVLIAVAVFGTAEARMLQDKRYIEMQPVKTTQSKLKTAEDQMAQINSIAQRIGQRPDLQVSSSNKGKTAPNAIEMNTIRKHEAEIATISEIDDVDMNPLANPAIPSTKANANPI